MSDVEWTDPPPPSKSGEKGSYRAPILAALQTRPGQWAIVRRNTQGQFGSAGTVLRKAGCEVATRKMEDGTSVLYARWPEVVAAAVEGDPADPVEEAGEEEVVVGDDEQAV